MGERTELRWRLAAEEDAGQQRLFEEPTGWRAGHGEFRSLEFLEVRAKRIINEVPAASHVPFRFTINAYRGCAGHGCVYCFSRPTHEYLGLNMGEDFERKIVVKINAVERTRAEVRSPKWAGDLIAMGTNTDPYQPTEGKYRLTRGIIEVLAELRNPFSILTKSTLILRDIDVLREAVDRTDVRAALSIGTLDVDVWKETEPGTPHPARRLDAVARLNEAGIPTAVLVAPILPGLSDAPEQVAAVAQAAREAGAVSVSPIVLHLRPGVREHYLGWLGQVHPELASLYARLYPRSYAPKAYQEEATAPARPPALS